MQPDDPMANMINCHCRYGMPDGWGHDCGWPDVPITPDADAERLKRGGYDPNVDPDPWADVMGSGK
jgi:hypothetical protein